MIERLKKIKHLNVSALERELGFYPTALKKAIDGTQKLSKAYRPRLEKWLNQHNY